MTHLFVRANYKQHMRLTFPDVTRVGFGSFVPDHPWQFHLWKNPGTGSSYLRFLGPPAPVE